MARPKVMVSGCFDMLHSGHVAFMQEAAAYGDLYVCIGSDATIYGLKQRWTINDEHERAYMIRALGCVHEVRVNSGSGTIDFLSEFDSIRPDVFVVNEDGHTPEKEALCHQHGVRYVVLKREPHGVLKPRSTTSIRQDIRIPYRIDLAGGWLDQPSVSQFAPGPVLTLSLEPTHAFDERGGMSTSTRRTAIELWGPHLPEGDLERMARVLFCCENPPGTPYISGSQDSIGIVYPGLNRLNYAGHYWPESIERHPDEATLRFFEEHLQFLPLRPREAHYNVLSDTRITRERAADLAQAADDAWNAALAHDAAAFGAAFTASFRAQVAMFPLMVDDVIREAIAQYGDRALGYKLSGAGGGGYLVLFQREPVPGTLRIQVRRPDVP